MLIRWVIALMLLLALVVTALDLSAYARHRGRARRSPSVADVVTGRGEDPTVPNASEIEEMPSMSPAITY
jgi:hypothetical protein